MRLSKLHIDRSVTLSATSRRLVSITAFVVASAKGHVHESCCRHFDDDDDAVHLMPGSVLEHHHIGATTLVGRAIDRADSWCEEKQNASSSSSMRTRLDDVDRGGRDISSRFVTKVAPCMFSFIKGS